MKTSSPVIARLSFGLAALAIVGCGGGSGSVGGDAADRHPVSGRVTSGGKPAAGVEVRLHLLNRSRDDSAPSPHGTTDAEGRFQLRTGDSEGAPNGQYLATLTWPPARGGGDRLGGAFAEPEGSGLTAVIDDATVELPPFEISAAPSSKRGRVSP